MVTCFVVGCCLRDALRFCGRGLFGVITCCGLWVLLGVALGFGFGCFLCFVGFALVVCSIVSLSLIALLCLLFGMKCLILLCSTTSVFRFTYNFVYGDWLLYLLRLVNGLRGLFYIGCGLFGILCCVL